MEAEEAKAFEAQLAADSELLSEKESLEELIIGIQSKGLKEKLSSYSIAGAEKKESTQPKRTSTAKVLNIRKLAVAAGFIGAMLCAWYLMIPSTNSSSQLYADAFTTHPGLPTPMSEVSNYTFYDGMVDYKMEKYSVALDKWSASGGTIGQDTLDFYSAMALLQLDKKTEALSLLTGIKSDSQISSDVLWYTLGIHLKNNDFNKAREVFEKVKPDSHPLYDQVKSSLEK